MRKILTACALCALALTAGAEGAVEARAQAAQQHSGPGWIKTANAGTAEAAMVQGPRASLANVAAPSAPGMQPVGAQLVVHKQDPAPEHEHRRRTGPAMLIAALVVMSAIALRRLGSTHL